MKKRILCQVCVALIVAVLVTTSVVTVGNPRPARAAFGDRITISNKQFYAGGARIWMNGANTPWHNWNDFGGSYDHAWWDDHFRQLHENGVNATRVWITCDGTVGINIDSNGYVSGATSAHWSSLDDFFQIAQNRQIYIMATLMSFDHFKSSYSQRWRNWINSDSNIDSYINNYLIPFLNRYKNNPFLWSIDLMNEPDWVYENSECGNISWDRLQMYFAKAARAIHENSQVLVTVGMAMPKYQSGACSGCQGNKIADSALQAKVNDPDVYIDFYSSHTYPWQDPYWGIPFYMSPNSYYGTDLGKLVMIGETPALGSTGHTLTQDYENAYLNGWQGVMPWTSNGVDGCGGFNDLTPATRAFRDSHYDLVFPGGSPSPTNTPAPGTVVIYDDSTTWENWSWSSTVNFGNTFPVYAGSKSIAVTYNSGWAALSLRKSPAQSTSGYTAITFWAHGGSSGTRQISVYVQTADSGGESTKINVDIPANQWTQFTISLSSLGNPSQIARLNLQDRTGGTQPTFYIDEVKLVGSAPSPTNTPMPTPTNTPTPTPTNTPTPTPTNTPTPTPTNTPTPVPTNLLENPGFESGTTNWTCNGCSLSTVTSPVHSGSRSGKVTNRSANWAGPQQDVTSDLQSNGQGTYYLEAWFRMASGSATAKVTLEVKANSTSYFGVTCSANSSSWVKCSGTQNITWSGTLQSAKFFLETTSGTTSFYGDDCVLRKQ